jgi:S-adenosylmethionine:tRNA ribosyltransferase-isomerase
MTLTSQFDFDLPTDLIAQKPVSPRDSSRLLLCASQGRLGDWKKAFEMAHHRFSAITDFLGPNDFLVFNDAKVLPVRLLGTRVLEDGKKGGEVEAVLLRRHSDLEWNAILHLSAKVKPGLRFLFEPGLIAEVLSTHEERLANHGEVRLRILAESLSAEVNASMGEAFETWLQKYGHVPLPPYIERQADQADRTVYQTLYAQKTGSAAAPTAGFHFTENVFSKLKEKGVQTGYLTLHVGLGTFRPIKSDHIEEHQMHKETFEISPPFAEAFTKAKVEGKRIVAVGTTAVRALESWAQQGQASPGTAGIFKPGIFETQAYITPGYQFKAVDDLITNFHLPRSTLLVLVSAAMGANNAQSAYKAAVSEKYRFFSYGDAMFIRGRSA